MSRVFLAAVAALLLAAPSIAPAQQISTGGGGSSVSTKSIQQTVGRPARIAFAGNSIGQQGALFQAASPWFWAQVRAPRLFEYQQASSDGLTLGAATSGGNFAVSGTKSGSYTGYTACNTTSAGCPDLNTSTNINRVKAWSPDILYIESGTNDSASGTVGADETFQNVKAFITSIGATHTIILPILPRTSTSISAFQRYNMLLRQYERTTPGIHVLWSALSCLIDETTSSAPVGGSSGAAGNQTVDGLHPAPPHARCVEPELTRYLDTFGVQRIAPRIPNQADVRSSTLPGSNLLGTDGALAGTYDSTNLSNGFGGTRAPGCWQASGGNAEVVATGSKSSFTYRGRALTAWRINIAPTAALTAAREVLVKCYVAYPSGTAYEAELQAIVRVVNTTAGLLSVNLSADGPINSVAGRIVSMGTNYTSTAADMLPTGIDEIWEMIMPGTVKFDAGGGGYIQIKIPLRNGTQPAADIYIAAVGNYLNVPLP